MGGVYYMNREIKFRVWDVQSKKFFCNLDNFPGEFLIDCNGVLHTKSNEQSDVEGGIWWNCVKHEFSNVYKFGGQFTGLEDKNGKEIYEGDIIEESWKENNPYGYRPDEWYEKNETYVVEYKPPAFILQSPAYHEQRCIEDFKREVIGNIFEHPELCVK